MLATAAVAAAWPMAAAHAQAPVSAPAATSGDGSLAKVLARGSLSVALYEAMPPFHQQGRGIDVEIAKAIADGLGVRLLPLPFPGGESMNDDLRNMVWRGHYLGYGPADLMLHVPVDRPLMADNPRVLIFAPYFREFVALARDRRRLPEVDSLDALKGHSIAVPGQSLAGWLLIGAEGGRLRDQLSTRWRDGTEAAAALVRGECTAAAGHTSELESVLGGDARFSVEPLPLPRARQGWAVGCAVRKEAADLAQAVARQLEALKADGRLRAFFERAGVKWRPG